MNREYKVEILYKDRFTFGRIPMKDYKKTIEAADEHEAEDKVTDMFLSNGYKLSDIYYVNAREVVE